MFLKDSTLAAVQAMNKRVDYLEVYSNMKNNGFL